MSTFAWVAAAIVAVTSASRITRLVTYDKYPPMMALRIWWDSLTKQRKPTPQTTAWSINNWNLLLHCGYCFSFWAMVGVVAWGYFTDWQTAWWLVNGTFGGSYLAAILMAHDGED